jgi:6,7-dimethyl-8-ribityllumazine synthase
MTDKPLRILMIEAPYYADIAAEQAAGALAILDSAGADVTRMIVPGALEIPAAIKFALGSQFDGFVVLGCVIRGETSHYDIVCNECARGVQSLAIEHGLAVGFGVLTVENEDQAWARARRAELDKGGEAARACLTMIALRRSLARH